MARVAVRGCSPGDTDPPSRSTAKMSPACRSAENWSLIATMARKCLRSGIARRRNGSVAGAVSRRECEASFNPQIARIDVEPLAAKETYEHHAKRCAAFTARLHGAPTAGLNRDSDHKDFCTSWPRDT